jgi:hypothetical protein
MSMDESSARCVVLAQAIETADAQGRLLSEVERGQIDREARQAALAAGAARGAASAERFLHLRAQRILQAVAPRSAVIASLQSSPASRYWLTLGVPLATLMLGALTERIADPHRVDLLSLPLLAIVLWNLLVYVVLAAGWLLPRRNRARPLLEAAGRWAEGVRDWRRRSGQLGADVAAQFFLRWQQAASALQLQRVTGTLHLAALGWGAGVAASLLVQGLVVQYRVGWESTFLDAGQVHAILKVLLMPVVALFPFEPFSVQDVANLQLGPGDIARADRRWVWMYAALLLVIVIVPRAILAGFAFWRAAFLARRIALDLRQPYFQRLISLLTPARVQLCLLTHRAEDRQALLRVLMLEPEGARTLISSAHGDALRLMDLSGCRAPVPAPESTGGKPAWVGRLLNAVLQRAGDQGEGPIDPILAEAREEGDVVLHVAGEEGDLEAAKGLLQWLDKPVLVLVNQPDGGQPAHPALVTRCRSHARDIPAVADVLSFDAFARCWIQEQVLLDAIGRCLPEPKLPGFARIAAAWDDRNRARFGRSMAAVAEHLLYAARQVQDVPSGALSVKSLLWAEREAQAQARQAAMDAVARRLEISAAEMFARLRSLHGIEDAAAGALQLRMEEKFVVQQAVDTPQAGIAGAATGAAMGASVDLLVGGLTLGAATALGALVGGSAGFIAAAWKNRSTSSGATVVQLSDEMMQAMVEAALLRYLAVVHYGRGPAGAGDELQPFWKSEVVAAVEADKPWLARFWNAARLRPEEAQSADLARTLEGIARKVLETLYAPPHRAAPS